MVEYEMLITLDVLN